jgi:hypothetical protein
MLLTTFLPNATTGAYTADNAPWKAVRTLVETVHSKNCTLLRRSSKHLHEIVDERAVTRSSSLSIVYYLDERAKVEAEATRT